MATHPIEVARRWVEGFSQPPLNSTLYAQALISPLRCLVALSDKAMPIKVRLEILFTGKVPYNYLETLDEDGQSFWH